MTESIDHILKTGPNQFVEFLNEIDELIDFAKICVSFSNREGGSLYIGVNEKGKAVGINPEPEMKLIDAVNDCIEGKLLFETVLHTVKHHYIIEVKISKSEIPLLVKLNDHNKVYYYRVGSISVEANKIIERSLNLRRFGGKIDFSQNHEEFLAQLEDDKFNLSIVYKLMELKPKDVDKVIAELIFMNKLEVELIDKKFYYSRLKS